MATHQVVVIARPPRRPPAAVERYAPVIHDLTIEIDTAIGRCVAAPAWLRPAFPAGCLVAVLVEACEGDEPLISKPRSRNRGGPKEIVCPVGVPVGWVAGGARGVAGIRMLRVVLQTLGVTGRNFGLGPPRLKGRAPGSGGPSSYAAAGADLDGRARAAGPGRLVAAARGPAGPRRSEILAALGTTEAESVLGAGREKIRVWTVRRHP